MTVLQSSLMQGLTCPAQGQQLGHRLVAVPTKVHQVIADCLNRTSSLRATRHQRLDEGSEVDSPS